MRIYITRPRGHAGDFIVAELSDPPLLPEISVYERDRSPTVTGLLNARGHELYAIDQRQPIGFVPLNERD